MSRRLSPNLRTAFKASCEGRFVALSHRAAFVGAGRRARASTAVSRRKPHAASEQTANRVMLVPDDRFSHVAGICADQAIPVEGTA